MAAMNPTGGHKAVPLDLPEPQVKMLRERLAICLHGVLADLNTPDGALDRLGSRREADAFERLLTGLGRGELVVPDEAARKVIQTMATAADTEDHYAEVVARHDALFGLLDRLGGLRIETR